MFPWYEHSEYSSQPSDDFDLSEEEASIKDEYDLTDSQIYWRRIMIHKLGADKFRREYPACLSDAYAQSGDAYLTEDDLKYIEEIKLSNDRWVAITPADHTDSYAIGVDVGTGTGADFSVAVVISKMTGQVAGIFRCNSTTPTDLAQEVFSIAQEYNGAKILVENNHVGSVVNQCLQGSNLWKTSDDKFWTTNQNNKRVMFEELKEAIRTGTINMLDTITLSELRSIKLDKHYNISLTRANGAHADSAVALALAFQALKNVRLPTRTFLPQWIKNRSADKIVNAQNGSSARRY